MKRILLSILVISMTLFLALDVSAANNCNGETGIDCESYLIEQDCSDASVYNCAWELGSCSGTIVCENIPDGSTCNLAGCFWGGGCSGFPHCLDYDNEATCEFYECEWNGCSNMMGPYECDKESPAYTEAECLQIDAYGCDWTPAACGGTPFACTHYTTDPPCGEAGCAWCLDEDDDGVDACDEEGNPVEGCDDPCDCDDEDARDKPGVTENWVEGGCSDEKDNDCDDKIDCQDPDCECVPPVPEFSVVGVGIATFVIGLVGGFFMQKKKK